MRLFIISYDIADDDRRAAIAACLESFGRRLQFSVFECALSDIARARLLTRLQALINHGEDQVLVFDLGALEARAKTAVEWIGLPYHLPDQGPIVV